MRSSHSLDASIMGQGTLDTRWLFPGFLWSHNRRQIRNHSPVSIATPLVDCCFLLPSCNCLFLLLLLLRVLNCVGLCRTVLNCPACPAPALHGWVHVSIIIPCASPALYRYHIPTTVIPLVLVFLASTPTPTNIHTYTHTHTRKHERHQEIRSLQAMDKREDGRRSPHRPVGRVQGARGGDEPAS